MHDPVSNRDQFKPGKMRHQPGDQILQERGVGQCSASGPMSLLDNGPVRRSHRHLRFDPDFLDLSRDGQYGICRRLECEKRELDAR